MRAKYTYRQWLLPENRSFTNTLNRINCRFISSIRRITLRKGILIRIIALIPDKQSFINHLKHFYQHYENKPTTL